METKPAAATTLLEDVIIELLFRGADRGAVLDPAGPTILVLLCSAAAQRSLGQPVLSVLRDIGDAPLTIVDRIGERTAVHSLLQSVRTASTAYLWFEMKVWPETRVIGICVHGPQAERIAGICVLNGCQPRLLEGRAS